MDDGLLTRGSNDPRRGRRPRVRRRAWNCTNCAPETSGLEELYFQLTAGQEQFAAPDPTTSSPRGHPMIALVRAEWTKLFTTRV